MKIIQGSTAGQSIFAKFIDHSESYGSHIIKEFLNYILNFEDNFYNSYIEYDIVDIGAGFGRDLEICQDIFNNDYKKYLINYHAIENNNTCINYLINNKIKNQVHRLNIEKDKFPFYDSQIDLFISNQVLEHTKEIFWILHETTRCLKVGGHLIIGVPNIVSLHNRILSVIGKHPTQFKSYSAHVRPFSKEDMINFMEVCFPGGYKLVKFAGSQFYPFPPCISKILCKLLPNMAFSIFFMFKKIKPYTREFLEHPVKAMLETNFYIGDN